MILGRTVAARLVHGSDARTSFLAVPVAGPAKVSGRKGLITEAVTPRRRGCFWGKAGISLQFSGLRREGCVAHPKLKLAAGGPGPARFGWNGGSPCGNTMSR